MRKQKTRNEAINFVIIAGIIYFWYNINGVLFNAMEGEAKAMLSIIMGVITWLIIGDKISKFI